MFSSILTLAHTVQSCGGRLIIVGGAVRDMLMHVDNHDIDVELFGMSTQDVDSMLLSLYGSADRVGRDFPVWKVNTENMCVDVALPRTERKIGKSHTAFETTVDSSMSFTTAASRRDFTINAIGYDPLTKELIDPFSGAIHIEQHVLSAPSDAFKEDPLRVLRAMQFAGRFDMCMDVRTIDMCASIHGEYDTLARERIWQEWYKWAAQSAVPSAGLRVLVNTGWVTHFPEIAQLIGIPQDPIWHPEGDVFEHTCHVVDAAANIAMRERMLPDMRAILVFAALCHDFGKVTCTQVCDDGRITAHGHADAGELPTTTFLQHIGAPIIFLDHVVPLVREHMTHVGITTVTRRVVNRLALRLGVSNIQMLAHLVEADMSGRPPLVRHLPNIVHDMVSLAHITNTAVGKPLQILMGRHLLQLGVKPGAVMGELLKSAYDAQLDDVFDDLDGAIAWIKELL